MTFEEFAARHLAALQRFAAVLTGHPSTGDDVVQEVLVRAHARWSRVAALDKPEFYVRKMIVNEFISSRRRVWRLLPGGSGTDVDTRIAPDHAAAHADRDLLLAELGKLPPRQRAVLVLRYYEGMTDREIADVLQVEPVTVRGYVARALAALRIEMRSGAAADGAQPANERCYQ